MVNIEPFLYQAVLALDLIVQFSVTATQSLIQQMFAELVFQAGHSFGTGYSVGTEIARVPILSLPLSLFLVILFLEN